MQLSIWLNCDKDVSYGRGCKYVRTDINIYSESAWN